MTCVCRGIALWCREFIEKPGPVRLCTGPDVIPFLRWCKKLVYKMVYTLWPVSPPNNRESDRKYQVVFWAWVCYDALYKRMILKQLKEGDTYGWGGNQKKASDWN